MTPRRTPPPTIMYRGVQRAVTPTAIAALVREGLTPADYERLDLIRDYYRFATIGDLIADALARAGEVQR